MIQEVIDDRVLDEWMYSIDDAIRELNEVGKESTVAILQKTLDDMRDRRATLRLRKHNETGY
jgi:hypothetical protein